MATTFALELANAANRSGEWPVYIRLTQERKKKRIKTNVLVRRKSEWNPKARNENWVRTADPDYAIKNEALKTELKRVKATYSDQVEEGAVSLQRLATAYKTADISPSFLDYVEKLAAQQ